jgi:polyhydroxybutyrate depolymerase
MEKAMKKWIVLILILANLYKVNAQLTTNTWNFGGVARQYLTYVPASYNGSMPVPVVFCLHGLGDNMNNFYNIGMKFVADTANFIVVVPQALNAPFVGTAWNSGAGLNGFTLNGSVDDVGFIGAIIDTLIANYNIDQRRVFSCGFSMGGFMSQRLACELNGRIAAVASVAGTIGNTLTCNPGRSVPVCHFHGTADSTIYYNDNQYGNDPEEMIEFWAQNNGCNASPSITLLPDIANDGLLVSHYVYDGCNAAGDVELFRVDSAEHVWLGPANDIFYTTEIWKFFMRQVHADFVSQPELNALSVQLFPNPVSETVFLEIETPVDVRILDITGRVVYQSYVSQLRSEIDVHNFARGTYTVVLSTERGVERVEKLMVQ